VDGATVMKMVWACFDHAYFDKMFGIAFVFYSVPVYFNLAVGSTSFKVPIITGVSPASVHDNLGE